MARRVKRCAARQSGRRWYEAASVRPEPHWRLITEAGVTLATTGRARAASRSRASVLRAAAYRKTTLGKADDTEDADGVTVLELRAGDGRARARGSRNSLSWSLPPVAPIRSGRCIVAAYVGFLKAERKTGVDTERRLKRNIPPKLGDRPVSRT